MKERTARELTVRIHALAQAKATELAASSLTVPLAYYRDRSLWDWERNELLRATPIAAAPSAQVAQPGDYHVRKLLGMSLLVTRGRDGRARVLLNYCSHRGARIAEGSGNRASFVCPYHHWTYGCDGKLLGRPRAEAFDDLPTRDPGLTELPCEERHGLIWCVLDPKASLDLDPHLGSLGPELAQWGYDRCTYVDHRDVEIGVNWKAGLENFAEFYHVPYVHQIVAGHHVGDAGAFDRFGRHHRLLSGVSSLYELSAQAAARVDDDAHLVLAYWVYPNLVVAVARPSIDLIQLQPGADPGSCILRHTLLARRPSLSESEREDYTRLWELLGAVFTGEDGAVLERAGDGIAHTARDHLLIGRNEPGVQNIIRTLQAASATRDH
ncbi:MAG: aromatic ring-hydroxylating oxygenase subunit alpha [Myxococcota bacterium]